MSNAESVDHHDARSLKAVELRVSARLENLAVVRTLIGAVGTFEDLDLDAVADLRLAVDEACTQLIRCADPGATLILVVDPRVNEVVVEVSTTAGASLDEILTPQSFSWHVLSSLTDDVRVIHDGAEIDGAMSGIAMTARRVSPAR